MISYYEEVKPNTSGKFHDANNKEELGTFFIPLCEEGDIYKDIIVEELSVIEKNGKNYWVISGNKIPNED